MYLFTVLALNCRRVQAWAQFWCLGQARWSPGWASGLALSVWDLRNWWCTLTMRVRSFPYKGYSFLQLQILQTILPDKSITPSWKKRWKSLKRKPLKPSEAVWNSLVRRKRHMKHGWGPWRKRAAWNPPSISEEKKTIILSPSEAMLCCRFYVLSLCLLFEKAGRLFGRYDFYGSRNTRRRYMIYARSMWMSAVFWVWENKLRLSELM